MEKEDQEKCSKKGVIYHSIHCIESLFLSFPSHFNSQPEENLEEKWPWFSLLFIWIKLSHSSQQSITWQPLTSINWRNCCYCCFLSLMMNSIPFLYPHPLSSSSATITAIFWPPVLFVLSTNDSITAVMGEKTGGKKELRRGGFNSISVYSEAQ